MSDDGDEASKALDEFIGDRGKNRGEKPRGISKATIAREEARARDMVRSGEWEGATATTFIALWSLMFERTYGVPAPLLPRERLFAARQVGAMLKREFGGDVSAMASFMRWAWRREKEREEWRRKNGRDGGCLGWRLLFGPNVLTDYRLAAARRGGA